MRCTFRLNVNSETHYEKSAEVVVWEMVGKAGARAHTKWRYLMPRPGRDLDEATFEGTVAFYH
jgi:hypothetical protein